MSVSTGRAERERVAHNEGLERAGYERVFGHAKYLYWQKTASIISDQMRRRAHGDFLEIGSTSWLNWLEPAGISPSSLTCINISEVDLEKGIEVSEITKNKPRFLLMDANNLEFQNSSFDVVYGGSILHHLDFRRALTEIKRVLKPGGVMIFREPLDFNPVAKIVRWATPKARTIDEQPLRSVELRLCRRMFDMTFYYEQLFSVPAGVVSGRVFSSPDNAITRTAFALDEALLSAIPAIGGLYRVVLLVGVKTVL